MCVINRKWKEKKKWKSIIWGDEKVYMKGRYWKLGGKEREGEKNGKT